ncbi:MAG: metallophosphoesterase family protein, partial [Syntrophomonadaceae bacterium]|nr:metallophosphoesterase family protein [Syntrophomonadaceae bacterium]
SQEAKVADLVAWAGAWGRGFATRQAALAAIGAMLAALLVGRARPRTVVAAGFLCALLVLGVIGYGAATFRLQAFEQPRYEGVLATAPDAIRAASRVLAHLDQLQDNAKVLVSTINGLFLRGNDLPILGINGNNGSTTRLLFISDLHSNPVGMEFVAAIVRQFKVDAVVDTGDLTDLGSPLEASLLDRLGALGVPYWLAGGNHDTPEVLAFIEDLPNGHLLRGAVADIEGVTVYGSADPLAVSPDVAPPDRETPDPQVAAQAESVQRALETDRLHPDVLVVHNPEAASRLVGAAPLVVTGHTHRQSLTRQGAGYLLNPGSAGAAGLQGLYAGGNVPYAAAVLLVDRQTGKMAVDLIRAQPDTGRFSFERRQLEGVLAGQGGQGGNTPGTVP